MNIYGFILVTGFFLASGFFFGNIIFKPLYQYLKHGHADENDLWMAGFLLMLLGILTGMGFMGQTITDGSLASFIGALASLALVYLCVNLISTRTTT